MTEGKVASEGFTPAQRRWQRRLEELQVEAVPTIRASAERWAVALTALLGLGGIGTVAAGPESFEALTGAWESIGKASALVASVVGMAALWKAASAAQVSELSLTEADVEVALNEMASSAMRALTCSRWLTSFAVLALLVAAACLWIGQQDKASQLSGISCEALEPEAPVVEVDGKALLVCEGLDR